MKKTLFAAFAVMVLMAGFAVCQEKEPSYLIMEGATVKGYTINVPAKLVIPKGVTVIGEGAFRYCTPLVSVTIPDSVFLISEDAFEYCISLESITIQASVLIVEDGAFDSCPKLKDINYVGTKAQFKKNIENGGYVGEADKVVIHCADGDIIE